LAKQKKVTCRRATPGQQNLEERTEGARTAGARPGLKKVLNIFQISNNVQNKKHPLIFTKTPARLAFTFDKCKPD
jgi:hypothetical protein